MSRAIIGRLHFDGPIRENAMPDLSRRTVLAGAAAAAAAPLATVSSVHAAAPPSGKQVPSYYRYKVGDFEVTAILDGVRQVKLETSPARNAKLEEVQAFLRANYLRTDQVGYYFHPTLVNTGSKLVLLDTGNGPGSLQAGIGLTPAHLAAAGVDPNTIDIVVISHFHGDHISGLRTADGALAYPNAEIKVPAAEWAFWTDEGNMSRAPQNQQPAFQNTKRIFGPIADKLTKYEWGKEVAPGITAIDSHGHTPGHTSFVIASGAGKVLVQADVTAGYAPIFVANPGWHAGGDMDGPQAVSSRRKLYDMLVAERMMMSGYHIPFPSLGYLEKAGDGYRLIPANWNPAL
jgi:glyoxylase-like metal-dependent hydrolase (beta-lactamase superfamily II)